MMARKRRGSRIYWRERGGECRAYGDFRDFSDVGGKLEALKVKGSKVATTDSDIAAQLVADRVKELEGRRRGRVLLGIDKEATLEAFASHHLLAKAKSGLSLGSGGGERFERDSLAGSPPANGGGGTVRELILTGEGRETIELVDAQVPRLRQVTGAVVTVCGESLSEGSRQLMVASFELRSVDGNEAYLGVIRSTGSGYVIDSGLGRPEVPIVNVPTALEEAEGQEVWVAGADVTP